MNEEADPLTFYGNIKFLDLLKAFSCNDESLSNSRHARFMETPSVMGSGMVYEENSNTQLKHVYVRKRFRTNLIDCGPEGVTVEEKGSHGSINSSVEPLNLPSTAQESADPTHESSIFHADDQSGRANRKTEKSFGDTGECRGISHLDESPQPKLDSAHPKTPSTKGKANKRPNGGEDPNNRPRKKPKRSYRPKIYYVEGKPRRTPKRNTSNVLRPTPKPKTPKGVKSKKSLHQKSKKGKTSVNKICQKQEDGNDTYNETSKFAAQSCKQKLNFGLQSEYSTCSRHNAWRINLRKLVFPCDLKRRRLKRKKKLNVNSKYNSFSLIQTKKTRSKRIPRRDMMPSLITFPYDCQFSASKMRISENVSESRYLGQELGFITRMLENLQIYCGEKQVVVIPAGHEMMAHNQKDGTLVPYEAKKQKVMGKVDSDMQTKEIWKARKKDDGEGMWKLLTGKENLTGDDEIDEEMEKWWEKERKVFCGRVDSFIARMHLIQGDRTYSPWKGSVVDSVVGVFLTQNVADHLSSSAYMALAARFPVLENNHCYEDFGHATHGTDLEDNGSQESVGSNVLVVGQEHDSISDEGLACRPNLELLKKSKNFNLIDDGASVADIEDLNISEEVSDGNESKKTRTLSSKGQQDRAAVREKEKFQKKRMKDYDELDWERLRREWEPIRKMYSSDEPRSYDKLDSVDWEAVRCADVSVIADAIQLRGQHNIIAGRIKDFLNSIVKIHGSIDLEWLRNAPPAKVENYLKEIYGLGVKSRECIRLLSLQHVAFPVDTNVGRIAVRLGWVPLQPLPDEIPVHLLEKYPLMDPIQEYLWPRLCKLDQRTLYELHYQMITFGKVFCTKRSPNCNSCPMRGDCRHFASAFASEKLGLPGSSISSKIKSMVPVPNEDTSTFENLTFPVLEANSEFGAGVKNYEPIIEMPPSPKSLCSELPESDIEQFPFVDDSDEIPIIKLNVESFAANLQNLVDVSKIPSSDISRALVVLDSEAASVPPRRLKYISRLRTEREVYELPDSHPLLRGLDRREPDDPSPYLLVIWLPEELGEEETRSSPEMSLQTIYGTILIPCRTAMRGNFPLNGTYFQVNEMFADYESSEHPIHVPRAWIWDLPQRTTYFGTSVSAIFRGISTKDIQYCFWKGFVCVRGFDRGTRAPKPLAKIFHLRTSKAAKTKANTNAQERKMP